MKLKLFLDSDSYECLLKHVPDQAPSRAAISQAVLLGHTRVVECDELELANFWSAPEAIVLVLLSGLMKPSGSLD